VGDNKIWNLEEKPDKQQDHIQFAKISHKDKRLQKKAETI